MCPLSVEDSEANFIRTYQFYLDLLDKQVLVDLITQASNKRETANAKILFKVLMDKILTQHNQHIIEEDVELILKCMKVGDFEYDLEEKIKNNYHHQHVYFQVPSLNYGFLGYVNKLIENIFLLSSQPPHEDETFTHNVINFIFTFFDVL